MALPPLVQRLVDLQNRINAVAADGMQPGGRITFAFTPEDIALLSYALGGFTGYLLAALPPPPDLDQQLKSLSTMRRAAKKTGVKA